MPGAISFTPQARRTLAPSHHGPGHSGKLVGKRDGGDLGRSPGQQCREPGAVFGTVDLGIADDGECTGYEQAAQIAVTLFADADSKSVTALAQPGMHYVLSAAGKAPRMAGRSQF